MTQQTPSSILARTVCILHGVLPLVCSAGLEPGGGLGPQRGDGLSVVLTGLAADHEWVGHSPGADLVRATYRVATHRVARHQSLTALRPRPGSPPSGRDTPDHRPPPQVRPRDA